MELMMKLDPLISVFTATYNRKHTLRRLFDSLEKQTFKNFEWVVVDDGSSDGTDALIKEFSQTASFSIVYVWQENGGKHTAYNRFAELARTEVFCSIDSDDTALPNCLERFLEVFYAIPENERKNYAGVMCLVQDEHENLIGDKFSESEMNEDLMKVFLNHKKLGDKGGLCKVSILKEFPFPSDVKKVYLPESFHIYGYASKYKTYYLNEILIKGWVHDGGDHLRYVMHQTKNYPGAIYGWLAWPKYAMRHFFVNPRLYIANTSKFIAVSLMLGWSFNRQFREVRSFAGRLLWASLIPLGIIRFLWNW
jgi:glycosyltransferase involved in cell wall biosynthesis